MRTRNLITTILLTGLITGATAACGHEPAAAPPSAAAPPAATSAPTPPPAHPSTPASPSASRSPGGTWTTVSKATPSGSTDPRSGTQYAMVRSSRPSTRQITYDLIAWYDGAQAVKACAEDGAKPAENDYCLGYYIRNNNTKLRTLTVHPDAPIRLTVDGEKTPVDLQSFLTKVGNGNVIRFDIDANRIIELEDVYLP